MPPPAEGFASRLFLGPALRAQPDRRLVTLVREGYEVAFEEIVRRYGKALGRYAAAIVGSRGEDVTQDALSKALLALRRDDAEIELRPWLYRIVRNTALNDLRDRPPEAAALAEAIASGRSLAEEVEQREELTQLIERLRSLPEPQRAAIVMRELEGLSHEEIAAALGLSGGGARQAIYRARQALRDGAALLLPLPLLRALIEHGGEAVAAGVGIGAGGAAATAAGGASAGGVALKAGVVAAVLAGSVGTGVALRDDGDGRTAGVAVAEPQDVRAVPLGQPEPLLTADPTGAEPRQAQAGNEPQPRTGGKEPGAGGEPLEPARRHGDGQHRKPRHALPRPHPQRPRARPRDRAGGTHSGPRPPRPGDRQRPAGDGSGAGRVAGSHEGDRPPRDGADAERPKQTDAYAPPPPPDEVEVEEGEEEGGREERGDRLP